MKVNELRIGNYVLYSFFGMEKDLKVHQWEAEVFKLEGELVKPIPLTEEWLLKFGFQSAFGCGYQFCYGLELLPYESKSKCYHLYDINEDPIGEEIKYVHQLQNLYFALTNEELICK